VRSALVSDDTPAEAVFQFPGGLADHLAEQVKGRECVTTAPFAGRQVFRLARWRGNGPRRMGDRLAAVV
jgi:hypothetical protein